MDSKNFVCSQAMHTNLNLADSFLFRILWATSVLGFFMFDI